LFIGDVGGDFWEEIDLGVPGGNFGWPLIEGPQPPGQPGYVYPLYSYPHDPLLGSAVIGGDHARTGSFAPEYEGNYFFADHTSGKLFRMRLDANNTPLSTEAWATGLNLPTEVRFGPDGSLYYLAFNAGEVWRIAYVGGGNRQPTAIGTVTPDNGRAPLTVTFDASASRDPDGDALSYRWSFGDGQVSAQSNASHTYAPGTYMAALLVSDGSASSTAPPFRVVSGNRRPTVQITSPPNESPYRPGQTIVFSGVASDPEEGAIGCERFAWRVIVHHLEHTHPFLGPTQGACQGTFVVPAEVSGHRTTESDIHFEINLSVEDTGAPLGASGILSGTAAVLIRPAANSANR
jgi:PKD repeat protein